MIHRSKKDKKNEMLERSEKTLLRQRASASPEKEHLLERIHHKEAEFWWQVTPALPLSSSARDYHVLRRIWGDHTMNTARGGRGYYHWGTEDNMTPGLFQTWSIFPMAIRSLLQATGASVRGALKAVHWSYACEEKIEAGRYPGVTGRFLIPDIVVFYEDDDGTGVLSFEVKRPGVKPVEKDIEKLRAYTRLPSMERINRRHAVFLVGENQVSHCQSIARDLPVLTWETMKEMQLSAAEYLIDEDAKYVLPWIDRAYSRYGIGTAQAPSPCASTVYASPLSITAVDRELRDPVARNFVIGSEVVEAFLSGVEPDAPRDWLRSAPSRVYLSKHRLQQTADRRTVRWSPGWCAEKERAVP